MRTVLRPCVQKPEPCCIHTRVRHSFIFDRSWSVISIVCLFVCLELIIIIAAAAAAAL